MGLQGVTESYQGLQGITGSYNGLQGITRGYRGLLKISETFFLARTSLGTLSWFILYKTQTRRNVQCLTPLRNCEFCAFLKAMFS